MVIVKDDYEVEQWLLDRLGYEDFCALERSIGAISEDGEILAAIAFGCFTGWDAEVNLATARPGALGREFLREAGKMAFEEMECGRLTITTSDPQVVSMALWCGAHAEGHKLSADGPGENAWMLGILRENWRWTERNHG